ncbi:MAG: RNB domain-containing ribonuclease [Pirellulales bacterium]
MLATLTMRSRFRRMRRCGHWLLGVHIADVSHFVPLNSQLDREARERATSAYLPDRVILMIPEVISNSLASLQPNRVRYTQTCWIEFTDEGVPVHSHVERAGSDSKQATLLPMKKWTAFREPRAVEEYANTGSLSASLENMHTLAMVLRQRRMLAGSIELTLPEVKSTSINKERFLVHTVLKIR